MDGLAGSNLRLAAGCAPSTARPARALGHLQGTENRWPVPRPENAGPEYHSGKSRPAWERISDCRHETSPGVDRDRAQANHLQSRLPRRLRHHRHGGGRQDHSAPGRQGASGHSRVPLLSDEPLPSAPVLDGPAHDPALSGTAERRLPADRLGSRPRPRRPQADPDPRRVRPGRHLPLPERRLARNLETPLRLLLRAVRSGDDEARRHLLGRRGRGADGRLRDRGLERHLRLAECAPHPALGQERPRLEPAPVAHA